MQVVALTGREARLITLRRSDVICRMLPGRPVSPCPASRRCPRYQIEAAAG